MWVLVVAVAVATAPGSALAASSIRSENRMLSVSQTIAAPTAGLASSVVADVGATQYIKGSLALVKGSTRLSDMAGFSFPSFGVFDFASATKDICMPGKYYGPKYGNDGLQDDADADSGCQTVGLAESDIRSKFDAMVAPNAAEITASMLALMKANNAGTGVYSFAQELGTTSLSGRKRLVWTLVVDASGKSLYGKSKVVRAKEFFLYVTYTPRRVAQGLPASWGYPDGGRLSWTLVDSKLQALSAGSSIDTGGYFDEPEDEVGTDTAVKCLIDASANGCSTPYPDVRSLLKQSGAAAAYVDYVHPVMPVYDNVEAPPHSGNFTSVARLVMNIPERRLVTTFDLTCLVKTYTYSNSGEYRFTLNHSLTRYFVEQEKAAFSQLANMDNHVLSPWESYALSLTVGEGDLASLDGLFIEPFMQEGPLLSVGLLPPPSSVSSVDFVPPPVCIPPPPPTPPVTPPVSPPPGP